MTITGDMAEADFSLDLKIYNKGDPTPSVSPPLAQHARLARQRDGWQIVSIR